ncbi:MAG: hypothetical protein TEF_11890 [Rhizobiales bacterium NRL2]|nr:MAG: hypothetical protein TEF_11890 [Rhizobiales bacterium NRL2]
MTEQYITSIKAVADRIGVSRPQIYELIRRGTIPMPRTIPGIGKNVFRASEIDQVMQDLFEGAAPRNPSR